MRLCRLIFLLLILPLAFSQAHQVERSAVPQYQFLENQNESGIQPEEVNLLFSILDHNYSQQIGNVSAPWTSDYDWKNSYLGAGSRFDGQNFRVMLWGGLIRARFMNFGALASVVCHELGHKLGGAPYQIFPDPSENWSSSEGQADFFAGSHCLPQVYRTLRNQAPQVISSQQIDPAVESFCASAQDVNQCRWVAQSGVDMIETLQVYYDLDVPMARPEIWAQEKPDETLYTKYPSDQCRMDIYKSAAENPKASRLRCWYRESGDQ